MELLFAARLARPDLFVAVTRLASKVTSWNKSHDRALHIDAAHAARRRS